MLRFAIFFFVIYTTHSLAAEFKMEVRTISDEIQKNIISLNPQYRIYSSLPEDFLGKAPLVIQLHGGGGKGDKIMKLPKPGILPLIEREITKPILLVYPQVTPGSNKKNHVWLPEDLNLLLKDLLNTLPIDKKRIYLTGYSMGGYGTWVWAGNNPEHFAAIIPCSGGLGKLGPKDISPNIEQWAKNLVQLPTWAFHGAKDKVVPVKRSETMVELIKKQGGKNVHITIFPDLGHNSLRQSYSNPQLAKWLFSQSKK